MGGGRYISHHVCASQLAWRRPPRPPRWKSTRVPRAPPPCPAPARPRPLPGLRPSPLPARRPPLPPVRGCLLRGASWGAGAPELREPRPHLWPPALTPGAPRRKAREAGRGFSPPPRAPQAAAPQNHSPPAVSSHCRSHASRGQKRAGGRWGLFLAASQEPRTRGNQHPASEWAGRLGRPPAGAAR